MFFSNYRKYSDAQLRPSLLWEFDLTQFDWHAMKNMVVQRVIERGRITDFYAALNLYGMKSFKEAVKNIPYLNKKDINFVCTVFGIKKEDLKCYTHRQFHPKHWNS
ncbi:MAG: hypothetical protein EOM44_10580 [Bacteroidia bacterium]|nr:hypothetical protein [Bacteroidia bacterium]